MLHAIAFVPADALGGQFLETPSASAVAAFETSAFSLKALAAAMLPLLERGEAPGVVGLDFDASVAWPAYDWAGVSKAALESINRYLARDLGPRGVRSNLVAAGPLQTVAASNIEGFDGLAQIWERQAPLGWDLADPSPVADACLFLLSPLARAITGEILHVDGGVHAMGAAPMPADARPPTPSRPPTPTSSAANSAPREGGPPARRSFANCRSLPRKPRPTWTGSSELRPRGRARRAPRRRPPPLGDAVCAARRRTAPRGRLRPEPRRQAASTPRATTARRACGSTRSRRRA